MIDFLVTVLIGWAAHQIKDLTEVWFGNGDMNRIASYTEGGLILLVAFAYLAMKVLPPRQALIAIAALGLVEVGVGSGTVIGYITDGDK